jgi:glycosyltransferase involved in cell wall biosynthesis
LADANLRQELGRKAYERAAKVFGWEETTRQYEALFYALLAKNGHRSARQ